MSRLMRNLTRAQAIAALRSGKDLKLDFFGEKKIQSLLSWDKVENRFYLSVWSGHGHYWTIVSWKQVLGFIRRNYWRRAPIDPTPPSLMVQGAQDEPSY